MCMDEKSYIFFEDKNFSNIVVLSFIDFELTQLEFLEVKNKRSKIEYYFTAGPAIIEHIILSFPEIDMLTYLDADLYFFSSPEPLFDEMQNYSIGIISHKLSGIRKIYEKYGIYNVGWLTFRRNENGLKCLEIWKNDCLNWCYDYFDKQNDRFADQKYLEKWSDLFHDLKIIEHKGANVAPWNAGNYNIHLIDNKVFIADETLIFYHFSSLKQINARHFNTGISKYFYTPSEILKQNIYIPYIKNLLLNIQVTNNNLIAPRYKYNTINWRDTTQLWSVKIRKILFDEKIILD